MNKTILRSMLAIFALTFIVVLSSCNKDNGVTSSQTDAISTVNTLLPDQFLPAFNMHGIQVTSSMDESIACNTELLGPPVGGGRDDGKGDDRGHNGGMDKRFDRKGPGFEFRNLLHDMKLTAEQFPVIQKAIFDYQQCMAVLMSSTLAARKEIMYQAEQQRKAIMTAFRTSVKDVTDPAAIAAAKQVAMDAIKALNDDTKAKLDALVDKTALCNCWTTLVAALKAPNLLTPDQIALIDKWIAAHPDPCAVK